MKNSWKRKLNREKIVYFNHKFALNAKTFEGYYSFNKKTFLTKNIKRT